MATIARSQSAGFTDYGAEAEDIARRRKMAEMMQMQALEPIKQETAGGYVVPISWTQGLAKALQAGVGGYQQGQLKDEARQLSERRNQALAQAIGGMPQATTETAPGPDDGSGIPSPNRTTTTQPTWQQNAGWLGNLAQIGPDVAALGSGILGMQQREQENAANREAKSMDRIMQLEARAQDRAMTLEARAEAQRASESLRRDLAVEADKRAREMQTSQQTFMANQNRQAAADRAALHSATQAQGRIPPGYRMTPDGNMEAIKGGPADLKAVQTDSGRGTVSNIVTQLRDSYDQLDKAGGITNPDGSSINNAVAGIASSGPGQAAGRLFGTQNQSLRNNIAQTRPLLLNAIKQATGMSAKQMDSNAEMKLYLQAATDPTLDIKANRQALEMLDKLYGLSGQAPQNTGASGSFGSPTDGPPPGAVRLKSK